MSYVELQQVARDALEQQTATAEILSAIRRAATDLQSVLEAVVESASRLCGAGNVSLYQVDGPLMRKVAEYGGPLTSLRVGETRPITRMSVSGRAILDRTTVHVPDHQGPEAVQEYPEARRDTGIRTTIGIPLLREQRTIGAFTAYRIEARPFSVAEIALLQTFADQAVIAIENARLFKELESRNKDLTESLDEQTATGDILKVISQSQIDVEPVFNAIAGSALRLCRAKQANVFLFSGGLIHLAAVVGTDAEGTEATRRNFPQAPGQASTTARAILTRQPVIIPDVLQDPELVAEPHYLEMVRAGAVRSTMSIPMLRAGEPIGAVTVTRAEAGPFSDKQLALLQTFADQAVIAIENVRLFTELQQRNGDLTRALGQQTATSEVLRVIAGSPTDVTPVFATIMENALRLCSAQTAAVLTFDGHMIHAGAFLNIPAEAEEQMRRLFPRVPDRSSAAGRAILTSDVAEIPDVEADPDYALASAVPAGGLRSNTAVPMLRDGRAVGTINLARTIAGRFSESEIALLRTFAHQAVIAIENVRLFTELQRRNRALTEALEQQTATAEILRIVSQSQTEVRPVFAAILECAVRLCGADLGGVGTIEQGHIVVVYCYPSTPEQWEAVREHYPRPVDTTSLWGRAAVERRIIHVPDVHDPAAPSSLARLNRMVGIRGQLAVPILRGGEAIGVLALQRYTPGPFSESQIELVQMFADQAVIAIENTRLFNELEAANRDLAAASRHKSEFLANMSHELRTPLNAVIGFSEVLSEGMFGQLNEKQEEYARDIYSSGQHLLSLINDILDLSKIEAGRMELEVSEFHLPAALDNALTLVRERAGRRSVALDVTVDERLGLIRADERKIRQVVLNLLSNAIKFTPEGGRIEVRATSVDGSAEVSVTDTGVGIAPGDQEAIFEEFKQVGTAAKKVEGTGLGLALSRKFIELHGGRIWVKSEPGVGSTFTFSIPVHPGV